MVLSLSLSVHSAMRAVPDELLHVFVAMSMQGIDCVWSVVQKQIKHTVTSVLFLQHDAALLSAGISAARSTSICCCWIWLLVWDLTWQFFLQKIEIASLTGTLRACIQHACNSPISTLHDRFLSEGDTHPCDLFMFVSLATGLSKVFQRCTSRTRNQIGTRLCPFKALTRIAMI